MGEQAAVGALTSPEGPFVTVRNGRATTCVVLTDVHAHARWFQKLTVQSGRFLQFSAFILGKDVCSSDSFLPGLTDHPELGKRELLNRGELP